MSEPLSLEHFQQYEKKAEQRHEELKASLAATDAVVTTLYTELIGMTPNVQHRLHNVEHNVAKLIDLTPGAGELRQPVYSPPGGDA